VPAVLADMRRTLPLWDARQLDHRAMLAKLESWALQIAKAARRRRYG
jgi:hypothetical protein